MPSALRGSKTLTDEEWQQARASQGEIDNLAKKWPLSAEENSQLDKLEIRRNTLWKKAISIPGLTAEERERLRLEFHVQLGTTPSTASPVQMKQWNSPPLTMISLSQNRKPEDPTSEPINPVSMKLISDYSIEKTDAVLEHLGENFAESALGEHAERFGDFLGIAKVAVAYKEGGASSALAAVGESWPRWEEAVTHLMSLFDSTEMMSEYYDDGIPTGVRCRPWETGVAIVALMSALDRLSADPLTQAGA